MSAADVVQAERLYREALALDAGNRTALENLVMICLQSGRPDEARLQLEQLVRSYPDQPLYCDRLATLLEQRGRRDDAIDCYRRLLHRHPEFNNSRFNLARLLSRSGHEQEALQEYAACLARGIEHPEEVHTNISAIHTDLHRHEAALQSLQAALSLNPAYVPALFNIALLYEEQGDWTRAREHFMRILEHEPRHASSLAHIANGDRVTDPVDPLVRTMKRALRSEGIEQRDREELLYALGKAHDDCGLYDRAFDYYQQANQCSAQRTGRYDAAAQERVIDQLIEHCDTAWLESIAPVSPAPHIFICGMFRSGSTLMEQILAAHPAITAGGEIDYFQRRFTPFPGALLNADADQLRELGQGYTDQLAREFASAPRVSNKRPDNFLQLGLIRALFPQAFIINTRRHPLDNCLSLFFQPLDSGQAYANDLLDAGHYYRQYRRLMTHWRQLPGTNITDVDYETLVDDPRDTISGVLAFLGLDWHEDCLRFYQAINRVRTASVHQVRRPLYQSSSGRWHNYASRVEPLRDYLAAAA